jgi:myosin-5
MSHTYEVGTQAWQPDPTEGWVASEVEQKIVDGDNVKLVFLLENGEVCRQQLEHASTSQTDRKCFIRPKRSRRLLPRSTTAMLPFRRL